MNVILLTVLLTLLGVGLVVLFVWLSVMSWKSIKHRKQSELNQQAIWHQFDIISTELEMREDGIRKDFHTSTEELHQRIEDVYNLLDKQVNELYDNDNQIEKQVYEEIGRTKRELIENLQSLKNDVGNLDSTIDLRFVQLESSIDSRFDKVYNTIQFNANRDCKKKKK